MDWQFFQPFFVWLSEHSTWASFIVFLIAFSESLFVVGIIVPGTILMFGVGSLIGAGVLEIKATMLVAFIGAVMGDGVSFWIGSRYHQQLAGIWPLKNNPSYLNRGQEFFQKHGGKSILLGRFIGPVRPFMPTIAGMMGMPVKYFLFMNVMSAGVWAPCYLLPGIVFGASIGLASIVGTRLMVLILSIVIGAIALAWLVKKVLRIVVPRMEKFQQKCYRLLIKTAKLKKILSLFVDVETNKCPSILTFSAFILLLILIFGLFSAQVFCSVESSIEDVGLELVSLVGVLVGDQFVSAAWAYFTWPVLSVVSVFGVVFLYISGNVLRLKQLLLVMIFGAVFVVLLNWIIQNVSEDGSKFADLKSVEFFTFFTFFSVVISRGEKLVIRGVAYTICVILFCVYFWFMLYYFRLPISVIFSSLLISFLSNTFIMMKNEGQFNRDQRLARTMGSVFFVYLTVGSLCLGFGSDDSVSDLAYNNEVEFFSFSAWQTGRSPLIPRLQKTIFSDERKALNVQWSGELVLIEQMLFKLGWSKPMMADYQNILIWLKPEVKLSELPRLPQIHDSSTEVLIMRKPTSTQAFELIFQLWPSHFVIRDNNAPLWVGSITRQSITSSSGWLPKLSIDKITHRDLLDFEKNLAIQNLTTRRIGDILLISDRFLYEK